MSSKRLAAVFSRCGLSSKVMDGLAECIGISRDVEPTPEDTICVEAAGSGLFIANIKRFEYMSPHCLQKRVAAIVGKPYQTIGFTEGHGGVKFMRSIGECPKTTVFVMYYKMCSRCGLNVCAVHGYDLSDWCSECEIIYNGGFTRVWTRHAYLKTRQSTDYACIPHIVKPHVKPRIVQPSIEQLLFGEDYQKQRKRKRNNKWPRTGKSTIYSHKPNRSHR
jgi:hypothetical protein